jgi:excisionase family DNA binding protein
MAKNPKIYSSEHAHIVGPLAVDIDEASEITNLSRSRLYTEIRQGRLKIRKSGRRTIILMAELERWLTALPPA